MKDTWPWSQVERARESGSQEAERSQVARTVNCSFSILAPRSRLKVFNSEFAETLVSLLPLQPTLSQMKSPLEDWLRSDHLVIEVPVLEFGKESVHTVIQRLAIRARSQGPRILLVVTPRSPTGSDRRSRGEHNMQMPIRRWNEWMSCPFQLKKVCSCRFADKGEGVHTWYYVGASFPAPWDLSLIHI